MNTCWLIGLGLVFLIVCGLWLIIPALHGVPWVPTQEKRIRRALDLVKIQQGEVLYDLGAGDGRVLILAAREFGACTVGIEIGPVQCALVALRAWFSGSRRNIKIRCGNMYRVNLGEADVVFMYLTSKHVSRLVDKLEKELRPGARVVSVAVEFPNWEPKEVDRENLLFIYEMPP